MLRSEIKESIDQLNSALEESGIIDLFQSIREREGNIDDKGMSSRIIQSSQEYKKRVDNFDRTTYRLTEILNITSLEDPNFWVEVLQEARSPLIGKMISQLSFAVKVLPKFKSIIEQEYYLGVDGYQKDKKESIDIILFETDRPSKPSRVTKTIEGVEGLYNVCSRLENKESSELTIAALDSGSNMSISFLGDAKPVKRLKEIVLSIWEWSVLYREKKVESRISAIQGSLEVYNEISELEKNGDIEEKRAEKIRKAIDSNVSKLVESGAVTSQVRNKTEYSPRSIMSPRQKLLKGKKRRFKRGG